MIIGKSDIYVKREMWKNCPSSLNSVTQASVKSAPFNAVGEVDVQSEILWDKAHIFLNVLH